MKKDKNILDEAINSLFKYTNIQGVMKDGGLSHGAFIVIANEEFVVELKSTITTGNKGIVLARLKEISNENNIPVLLITKYIPREIAKEYVEDGINYLDIAGNCNIRQHDLLLLLEGKKIERTARINQPRAFQEAGIRLLFQFFIDPEKIQLPYRDLAEIANISLGSVGTIMKDLLDLNFILRTKQTKKLKNTRELLNRWIIAYHDVLRPRLFKKKMRFLKPDNYNKWKEVNLDQSNGNAFWGGEPAANLLTGYLHPGVFTIYTDRNWQNFKETEMIPDENGNIELLEIFWNMNTWHGVPPVLVYADLMSSGSDRNVETAKLIMDNELQYFK